MIKNNSILLFLLIIITSISCGQKSAKEIVKTDSNPPEITLSETKVAEKDTTVTKTKTAENDELANPAQNFRTLYVKVAAGELAGDLLGREVLSNPDFKLGTIITGTIHLSICVNAEGEVFGARYMKRGSTTDDYDLKEEALKNAKEIKFAASELKKQCGTVTYKVENKPFVEKE